MSHKRKGQLITSAEWARHLRPFLRRVFWKKERQAAMARVRFEAATLESIRSSAATVEALLAAVESLSLDARTVEVWVPEALTLGGNEISQELAMTMLLDKLVARELLPDGFSVAGGGRLYRYRKQ